MARPNHPKRVKENIDFNLGILFEENRNIKEVSEELFENFLEISSRIKGKMETTNY